jgi:hypothetical protein
MNQNVSMAENECYPVTFAENYARKIMHDINREIIFKIRDLIRCSYLTSVVPLIARSLLFSFSFLPFLLEMQIELQMNSPQLPWVVQKYGGTSVGKFLNEIADTIIP